MKVRKTLFHFPESGFEDTYYLDVGAKHCGGDEGIMIVKRIESV